MKLPLTVLLMATLILSGCGWSDSRINPGNWFGRSRSVANEAALPSSETNQLIPKTSGFKLRPAAVDRSELIAVVKTMDIERDPSGAIVRASGVAARQGAYRVELRSVDPDMTPEDGVLTFDFRVVYPEKPTPVGSERSRTVHDAVSLTTQQLEGVRTVRVRGVQNALESRRR